MSRSLIDECGSGNVEGTKQMILNGEDINMTNSSGHTPLYTASDNGHLEIVALE